MFVYRISRTKYASNLSPSGVYGRWNPEGSRMIYATGSVALACLENAVHRTGASLSLGDFSISIIEIDKAIAVETIKVSDLIKISPSWHLIENYHLTQKLGDEWLKTLPSAVLQVPSAIIDLEFNYLLNPSHVDFSKIRIVDVSPFKFDPRLKSEP